MGGWSTDAPGVRRHLTVSDLPAPHDTPSVDNGAHGVGRPEGAWPQAPKGFKVEQFAQDLSNPRKIVTAPNGDLFVAESGANRVKILRAPDGAGKVQTDSIFADDLRQPFGIAFYPAGPNPQYVYVANTDSVVRFPYHNGDLKATGAAEMIVPDIPGGGRLRGGGHWTRDVAFSPDGGTMYVSVGSHSNHDDADTHPEEFHRADILEYTPIGHVPARVCVRHSQPRRHRRPARHGYAVDVGERAGHAGRPSGAGLRHARHARRLLRLALVLLWAATRTRTFPTPTRT